MISKISKIIFCIFIIVYPFLIFLALKSGISPRFISIFFVIILFSFLLKENQKKIVIPLTILILLTWIFNKIIFLKFYPVIMNISLFTIFFMSLRGTPIAESVAVKRGVVLDPSKKAYVRKVTKAWVYFFIFNGIVSFVSIYSSMSFWTFYNGFLSYILIGMMFVGEYVVRRSVFK